MSKITISAVLTLLRFVMAVIAKSIRVIYAIIDLVDDGCLNNSAPRPSWMSVLSQVLVSLQSVGNSLSSIEVDVCDESIKGSAKAE